jgi:hypothetical protein
MPISEGDYYQLLKLDRNASGELVTKALWRYESAIGGSGDSDVGEIILAEAKRVLEDGFERSRYDEHLRLVAENSAALTDWPTPWPYIVKLSEPMKVPFVSEPRCQRCSGVPARRATLPRFTRPSTPKILENRAKDVSYIVQNCRSCGMSAAVGIAKSESTKVVVLLVAALLLGIFVNVGVGLLIAFVPIVLMVGIGSAWLRFRSLSPVAGQLPRFARNKD